MQDSEGLVGGKDYEQDVFFYKLIVKIFQYRHLGYQNLIII